MRANNALIKNYEKSFLKQEIDYLTNFQHKSNNFYGLPKICKSKNLQSDRRASSEYISCFQPKDLKLRSIVAGHKRPIKHLRNFVDIFKPLLSKIKSYVKDDFDFLKKCKRNLKHFVFNEGTNMGTIVAPKHATLVMRYLEIQFYEKLKNEFGVKNGKYIEENWHRFLDDCYIALDATNINPLKLFDILNNIHDNIKFTMEQHNLYFPFLDIMINKDSETNNIWMDIFYKKKLILVDVFHLPLVAPKNAKTI